MSRRWLSLGLVALWLITPAAAQVRARVTFEKERAYTGELSVDEDGELVLDCDVLGGPAVIDFARVMRLEVLDPVEPAADGETDVMTALGGERYRGQWLGLDDESVRFESIRFGELTVRRELVGDVVPRGGGTEDASVDPSVEADEGDPGAIWSGWEGFVGDLRVVDTVARFGSRGSKLVRDGNLLGYRLSLEFAWKGKPEFRLELGGLTLGMWGNTPALFSLEEGEIELSLAELKLEPDSGAIFNLYLPEDEELLVLESIEPVGGEPSQVALSLPLRSAPDRLKIESLGRPLELITADIRHPKALVGEDGLVRLSRPLRQAEVTGYDAEARSLDSNLGRVAFDGSAGVAFISRERRSQLSTPRATDRLGHFRTRSGEAIATRQLLFERGRFIVRSPYGSGPVQIPFEDFLSARMPTSRKSRGGGADYRMSFDGGAQITAGFLGIERVEGGYEVKRTEPGFKTPLRTRGEGRIWIERTSRSLFHASRRMYPHDLLLADGQTFPVKIEGVDSVSITVATPFTDEPITLRHDEVKALMFEPRQASFLLSELSVEKKPRENDQNARMRIAFGHQNAKPVDRSLVTEERLRRALMVPRSQVENPGKHLVVARNGDLLRCNVVGFADDKLEVDGGAGGPMTISVDVLAVIVEVEPPHDGEVDPREARIRTRRSAGRWTCNLGPRATLIGAVESGDEPGSIVLTHGLLGPIELQPDEFKRLDHGRGFAPKFRKLLDWCTEPMPAPNLGDD